MYKLRKGDLRTVIYNTRDLDLYRQAGWTLIEDEPKEDEETPKAQKDKVDEQSNNKRKSVKK